MAQQCCEQDRNKYIYIYSKFRGGSEECGDEMRVVEYLVVRYIDLVVRWKYVCVCVYIICCVCACSLVCFIPPAASSAPAASFAPSAVALLTVHITSRLVAAERRLDFRGRFMQFRIVHVDVQLFGHLLGDLGQIFLVLDGAVAIVGQLARQMAAERGLNTSGRIAQLCVSNESYGGRAKETTQRRDEILVCDSITTTTNGRTNNGHILKCDVRATATTPPWTMQYLRARERELKEKRTAGQRVENGIPVDIM